MLLDKAQIKYTPINAEQEKELVNKYEIKQAPTLVITNNKVYSKLKGVSEIKKIYN